MTPDGWPLPASGSTYQLAALRVVPGKLSVSVEIFATRSPPPVSPRRRRRMPAGPRGQLQSPTLVTVLAPAGQILKYESAPTTAAAATPSDTWGMRVPAALTRILPQHRAHPTV